MSTPDLAEVARPRFARGSLAPLMADWACVLLFVFLGKENHGKSGGALWLLTVWWPLAVGIVVGAIATRLYTDERDWPASLIATIAIAVVVGGPLRALTGRPFYSAFTLVALVMLSLLTFGWRLLRIAARRTRAARSSSA